tara:strand:- start:439 stop:546 length:108 start_codon:yes stop_codon:yes gene_type:complete
MWCESEITDNISHFCRLICFEEFCMVYEKIQAEEE